MRRAGYTVPHMEPKPTLLIILDGFGLADPKSPGNAITPATAPNIFGYMKEYPHAELEASGEAVGLFKGQQGNSEAGHMNIGAGRVVKQDLVTIDDSIHDGTFFKNSAFKQALFHAKKYHTAVHIMGLLTDGNSAHAFPEHLYALLEFFRAEHQDKVFLHLFTDGRDSGTHEALQFLHELRGHLLAHEKIATIMGRFYGMDRNKVWERTKRAYEAIVFGHGHTAMSAEEAISQAYNRDETDEFIAPTVIVEKDKPVTTVEDNDVIFFTNARSDRARQITKAFVQPDFEKMNGGTFKRARVPKHIRFVAMTDFGPDLPGIFTAFPSPDIKNSLAAVIGDRYRQLYISETEKYAHVTYFINGGFAEPINGEDRELVKSPVVYSYVERPQMQTALIAKKILQYLKIDRYNFICVNFPNADMVGHTGSISAAKKAIRVLDQAVKKLVEATLAKHGQVMIVSDHGNAEMMVNEKTGEIDTEHSINLVPCIVIGSEMTKKRLPSGKLCDVAPTLLKMMGIPKPKEMTGKVLL